MPQHHITVTVTLDSGDSAQAHSCFQLQTERNKNQSVCDVEDDEELEASN